jgi:hypothetical protein
VSAPNPTPLPDRLPRTYGPGGQEGAVRDVVRRELEPLADASGQTARAALPSLPTPSTRGSEVPHSGTVHRTARLLAAFPARPLPVS